MKTNIVATIAIAIAIAATAVSAQNNAPPVVTKADVQKFVDGVKSDKAKMTNFCNLRKLQEQALAIAAKNENDPALQDINVKLGEYYEKIGPDFDKITSAPVDDASHALLAGLAGECK
jgi:hypothetical protein